MKKFVAVFLCMVMMMTMIPSFFASAAVVPADETAVVVAADDTGSDNKDTESIGNTIKGFIELWGGLLKAILGQDVIQNFLPALKKVLFIVSPAEFFKTLGQLWNDITKK